jgi:hypothetical protein
MLACALRMHENWFQSLSEARKVVEAWREDYNSHPLS